MPELAKIKHERFCQFIAIDGLDATAAYVKVQGRKTKRSKTSAYRWRTLPSICARIDELLDQKRAIASRGLALAVERTAITKQWIMERLQDNVERAMQAKPVRDMRGNETGVYRYEANAANRGLELLGKELGMFREDRAENSFLLDRQRVEAMTQAERIESNRQLLEEAKKRLREYRAAQLAKLGDTPGPIIDAEAEEG
jgi:phage terminase small subunit